jgi:hypothetical protein
VLGTTGAVVVLRAIPAIHADGSLETPPEGVIAPSVVGWNGGVARGDRCEVSLDDKSREVDIHVAINDEYGVTLDCFAEDGSP